MESLLKEISCQIEDRTRYLKGLLERFDGDLAPALAAYNWGMGNVARHPERMPKETRAYVARVMHEYAKAKYTTS